MTKEEEAEEILTDGLYPKQKATSDDYAQGVKDAVIAMDYLRDKEREANRHNTKLRNLAKEIVFYNFVENLDEIDNHEPLNSLFGLLNLAKLEKPIDLTWELIRLGKIAQKIGELKRESEHTLTISTADKRIRKALSFMDSLGTTFALLSLADAVCEIKMIEELKRCEKK